MTREQYISNIFNTYSLVNVLSEKNGCRVLRLRNKTTEKDIVLRSFPHKVPAYEELYSIKCRSLPLIYDVLDVEDGQIVLEEYIDGMTVSDVMESGKYHYHGAKRVIKAVCEALSVFHERNLVHRDVKPDNVLIDKNGRIVLVDFNASRKISPAKKDTVIMGTVGYASPEQLGVAQSDSRTDIYAVGIMLNVMITGKHPSDLLARGKVGRIVRKCTNVNPDERYPTVKKLSDSL